MTDKADVLVIGGGVVGLCAAYFLRRTGRDVTVLTRDPVGTGASAGNAGMIVPSHIVPLAAPGVIAQGLRWLAHPESPFYIKPRADAALAQWLLTFRRHCTEAHVARAAPLLRALSLASVELFEEMQNDLGDFGFAQTGLLMLYHTEKGRKENLRNAALAEEMGLVVERLDAEAVRALEPGLRTPVEGAVLYRQDGRVDPDRLLRRLAEALRARGVALREGLTVTGFERRGDRLTGARTTAGLIEAETVVLAAGAWSGRLAKAAGVRLPVQPAKGYSLTLPAPNDGPRLPMILTDEKTTVTPMPGRIRFAGTLALAGFDPSVDPRRSAPIRRLARRYAPDASEDDLDRAGVWSGFRPCSPDGLPLLGRSPRHANLFFATGHGMMGVTLAPVTGKLLAEFLTGVAPSLPLAPLAPERFG